MRAYDKEKFEKLNEGLNEFEKENGLLPGIKNNDSRIALLEQILESIHRVDYINVIKLRGLSEKRIDPNDLLFDPIKAALYHQKEGNLDESYWCIFLSVHFGKHSRGGWRYVREIYGRLGDNNRKWDWISVASNPNEFRKWLNKNISIIKRADVPGGFGNHRKYESLNAYSPNGTGEAVSSYVKWIGPLRSHQDLMDEALVRAKGDIHVAFDILFKSMKSVSRFGRTARFDYLTMIGKVGLTTISPGCAYLSGSTGPLSGAKLLFGSSKSYKRRASELENLLGNLDKHINVGMQVIEDSLCNWQKNPNRFIPFRG